MRIHTIWDYLKRHPIRSLMMLFGVLLLVYGPVFILHLPAVSDAFDYSNSGQVGDTIGGITAPIIGLIGAFLVYLSFVAQVEANRIQNEALEAEIASTRHEKEMDLIFELYREWRQDFDNLEFESYTGSGAVMHFLAVMPSLNLSIINHPFIESYLLVLQELNDVSSLVEEMQAIESEQRLLRSKIGSFYSARMKSTRDDLVRRFKAAGLPNSRIGDLIVARTEKAEEYLT